MNESNELLWVLFSVLGWFIVAGALTLIAVVLWRVYWPPLLTRWHWWRIKRRWVQSIRLARRRGAPKEVMDRMEATLYELDRKARGRRRKREE